jgi:hypothetical protein
MRRMAVFSSAVALALLNSTVRVPAEPRPGATQTSPTFLDQAWNEDDRSWFYTITQGSQMMPYYWFLALERADSDKPFLDDQLARFGYLPAYQTEKYKARNPDRLPVGFVRDNDPERGPWAGMTCAACHTNQISFPGRDRKVLLQIDGGPTNANFFELLHELAAALEQTTVSQEKFDRFAAKVVSLSTPPAEKSNVADHTAASQLAASVLTREVRSSDKERLRKELDRFAKGFIEYVNISRTDVAWGPARLDAFGEIFNRATAIDLNIPSNNRSPDAPVSYPFLWDTSWHDFVQWNGSASNRKAVERLARNVGEVLGVFGYTEIKETVLSPWYYNTSVDRLNLLLIEQRLRKLTSPLWPVNLAKIDSPKAAAGKVLYEKYCVSCHAIAKDRTSANRSVNVTLTPLDKIGTDPMMTTNASTRESSTGVLEGVRMPPIIGESLGAREKSLAVTSNVVIGAILAPHEALTDHAASLNDINKKLMRVIATNRAVKTDLVGDLRVAIEQRRDLADIYKQAADFIARSKEMLPLQYKARPLNGIWATGPYLHNGSVPNLYQLMLPAAKRDATFTVGSREFDPEKVGFLSGPSDDSFTFDTSLPGNSNRGHEGRDYGTDPDQLTEEQRWQLIEYLKTL